MNVLVIGATGTIGRQVVAQLPTRVQIRAMARNPQTAALPSHVEVVPGDLTLPETLDKCLDSVDAVFLLWIAPPAAVAPALDRIVSRARRVVFLSSPHRHPHPFFQAGQPNPISTMQAEIERLIEASNVEWTFLRPGMLAANTRFWWGPQIRAGADVVRWPHLAALTAPIDERDIAAVAVRALCDDGHAEAEYILTGPESMTQQDQISTIGDVIARKLRAQEITPDEARQELGMPPFVVNMLLKAWSAAVDQPALVTPTVAEITGKPARTFRDWATDNAAAFRK